MPMVQIEHAEMDQVTVSSGTELAVQISFILYPSDRCKDPDGTNIS